MHTYTVGTPIALAPFALFIVALVVFTKVICLSFFLHGVVKALNAFTTLLEKDIHMVFLSSSKINSELTKSEKLLKKLPYWKISERLKLELKLRHLKEQLHK